MKLLKILERIFGVIVLALAGYALITQNYEFMPYMFFAQGIMMFASGLLEKKEERRKSAIFSFIVSIFLFIVAGVIF